MNITADTLTNKGATSGSGTRTRTWRLTASNGTYWRFKRSVVDQYNAQGGPKSLPVGALSAFPLVADTLVSTAGASLAPAIIQAGGAVNITATKTLINSSETPFTALAMR